MMRKSSDANFDCEQFILEMKRRPVLWDKSNPDYNHRQAKLSAWEEVAANLHADSVDWSNYDKFGKVRDIQKRWKNMRDSFIRELKYNRKVEKGMVVPKKKRYLYSHLLTFLIPEKMAHYNSSPTQNTSERESDGEGQEDSSRSSLTMDEACSTNQGVESIKMEIHPLQEDVLENSVTTQTAILEQDEDRMFLLSLLPYFKKFSEEKKLQARINVEGLIQNMLYSAS